MIQTLYQLDVNFLLVVQRLFCSDFLTPIMKFITHLGDSGLIWIVFSVLLCFPKQTRKVGFLSLMALLCSFLVNNMVIKVFAARTRPYDAVAEVVRLIERQSDYSFPSGHTAASFASAVVFYKLLPKKLGIPALVLAVLIAFSRMYVGVHYPSDVLGGAISGTIFALLVVKIWRRFGVKDALADSAG